VLLVERWILARLRHRTFFSLVELNAAIRALLEELNRRPFRKLPGSRRSLFEALDRPALKPLPERAYEYATWRLAKVNVDYHVEADRHWYSVPYQLAGQKVDVRLTATTVEAFHRGRRVASHLRGGRPYRFTTDPAHMPAAHRAHREWSPGRLVRWGRSVGPKTAELVEGVLGSRPHPEQGYRSCLGILRLGRHYGEARLEAASARALVLRAFSYRSVESILRTGLDRQPLLALVPPPVPSRPHENLRGPGYYR
jgi:transposase